MCMCAMSSCVMLMYDLCMHVGYRITNIFPPCALHILQLTIPPAATANFSTSKNL